MTILEEIEREAYYAVKYYAAWSSVNKMALKNLKLIKALKLAIEQRNDSIHIDWSDFMSGFGGEPVKDWEQKLIKLDAEIEKILSEEG